MQSTFIDLQKQFNNNRVQDISSQGGGIIFTDQLFFSAWSRVRDSTQCFKYKVFPDSLPYRVIPPGTIGLMAQFNPLRGELRRRPQATVGLRMAFDEAIFNFTRVSDTQENLFKLSVPLCTDDIYILINNSPIEFGSSLLVPDPRLKYPQVLTLDSIKAAVSLALTSTSPHIKLGFNSLGAAASVNHLHWHIYYQTVKIPLQVIEAPRDGLLTNWLLPGYVIQLHPNADSSTVVEACEKCMKIVNKCLSNEISHNLFICKSKTMDVRLFIFPRKQNLARVKDDMGLIAAFCEFSGFFICKTQRDYDDIDEERVKRLLNECQLTVDQVTSLVS